MSLFCTKCGSISHAAFDCSKPDQKLAPPITAAPEPENAANLVPGAEKQAFGAIPELKLRPPRWPGGPPVCSRENLPALEGDKGVRDYIAARCFGASVRRVWDCPACGFKHFEAKHFSPSGDNGGHGRTSVYPRTPFKPFRRQAMRDAAFAAEPDLPVREVPEKAAPKDLDAKPRKQLISKKHESATPQGSLF